VLEISLLALGLAGLWVGTHYVVEGAANLAKVLGISDYLVGLVVLSIGSDLPEIAIALKAGLQGVPGPETSGIIVGSALGSALGQFGLVLAILGISGGVPGQTRIAWRDIIAVLGSIGLLAGFALDGVISKVEGIVLIGTYGLYLFSLLHTESANLHPPEQTHRVKNHYLPQLLCGVVVVILASHVTVDAALALAKLFAVESSLVSLLIIGVGTSLPELSISLGALLRGKTALSVGNLIGSNILDTLLPIGLTATFVELLFPYDVLSFDLATLFAMSLLVVLFLGSRVGMGRIQGSIILLSYLIYVYLKL
jgi:cation:H+ antiporter